MHKIHRFGAEILAKNDVQSVPYGEQRIIGAALQLCYSKLTLNRVKSLPGGIATRRRLAMTRVRGNIASAATVDGSGYDMSFELTINRVGAFAGTTSGTGMEHAHIQDLFETLLCSVAEDKEFKRNTERIFSEATNFRSVRRRANDPEARNIRIGGTGIPIRIRETVIPTSKANNLQWNLVGTLPTRRFACTATSKKSGRSKDWIVHARSSITACALENRRRNTKLWWTFEGVPEDDDPTARPTADDVSAFVAMTDEMADAAIDPLYTAFGAALAKSTSIDLDDFFLRKNRIRVRMSDSNDYDIEALLDAYYYQHRDVSEIRDAPDLTHARKGLLLFEQFVSDVARPDVHVDNSLKVEGQFDGFKGIYYRTIVDAKDTKDTIVVGIGHQSGSVSGLERAVAPEKRRLDKQENNLRAMSASRPISAVIADREAADLEMV
jgi:hypothetical protein